MGEVSCKFNSVNGSNTGVYTRYGTSNAYQSAGILYKKNCPNGIFKVESTDGTNNYFRLVNPDSYPGIKSNGKKVYVFLSSSFLEYPRPDQVVELGRTSSNSSSSGSSSSTPTIPNRDTSAYWSNNTSNTGNSGTVSGISDYLNSSKASTMILENTRVFGSPFQFSNIADNRPFANDNDISGYGRKYLENIVAESPIIYITPGVPNYMPGVRATDKQNLSTYISNKTNGIDVSSSEVSNAIEGIEGRYYDFVPAYAEYMRYVNLLCRTCARYMGLCDPDETGKKPEVPDPRSPGKHYDDYDWGRWTNMNYSAEEIVTQGIFAKVGNAFLDPGGTVTEAFNSIINGITDNIFGDYKFLKCYVDPSVSFSESNSNSTTSSIVANLFDTVESVVREANFLSSNGDILEGLKNSAQSFLGGITGLGTGDASNGLEKLLGNATHVISGSNIILPELWGDSQYDKSYSFTVDLVSPYGDIESCYLNIIVPMMHLIAISMPRQTSANSFGSPFLVKLFAKGWFSCDLGIVSSIRIEKQADSWNIHGIPNHVKVELSVTDLYTSMSISKTSTPKLFFANQGLIEFLAVTSGLNITQGNIGLKIDTIIQTYTNTLKDLFPDMYDSIVQSIRNAIEPWFKNTR